MRISKRLKNPFALNSLFFLLTIFFLGALFFLGQKYLNERDSICGGGKNAIQKIKDLPPKTLASLIGSAEKMRLIAPKKMIPNNKESWKKLLPADIKSLDPKAIRTGDNFMYLQMAGCFEDKIGIWIYFEQKDGNKYGRAVLDSGLEVQSEVLWEGFLDA